MSKQNLILRINQFTDVRCKKWGDLIIFSKYSTLFWYKNKSLSFGKKLRISKEQSQACCPAEHKNKVSRLAISKVTKKNIRTKPGRHLYCTEYRLVLFSHFNITKLFNDHILICLLTIHWPVKLHFLLAWALKQAFFSFWLSVVSLLQFLVL